MDIPFYDEIYKSPIVGFYPGYYGAKPFHGHKFKVTSILDETKVVKIIDAKQNVRYRVVFTSRTFDDGTIGYQVEVVHYYLNSDAGLTIYRFPKEDGEYEIDYHRALKEFKDCILRYDSLVRAEVRDFKDIEVYKDRIDYSVLKPDCCLNCKWCRRCHSMGCCHADVLECHNPKNLQQFTYSEDFYGFPNHRAHRYCKSIGWLKLPWQHSIPPEFDPLYYAMRDDSVLDRIFPHVEPLGTCKNFEKKDKHDCHDLKDLL